MDEEVLDWGVKYTLSGEEKGDREGAVFVLIGPSVYLCWLLDYNTASSMYVVFSV